VEIVSDLAAALGGFVFGVVAAIVVAWWVEVRLPELQRRRGL
jgi:membrane associated rhomboid family serine protease